MVHSNLLPHALQPLAGLGLYISLLIAFARPGLRDQMLIGATPALAINFYRSSVFLLQNLSFACLTPTKRQTQQGDPFRPGVAVCQSSPIGSAGNRHAA